MLVKLSMLWLVICFAGVVNAQDEPEEQETQNKRPSWSEGLPERQKSTKINTADLRPEEKKELELDMSGFGIKEKPKVEIEMPIKSVIGIKPVDAENETDSEQVDQVAEAPEQTESEPSIQTEAVVETNAELQQEPAANEVVANQPVESDNSIPSSEAAISPVVEQPVVEESVVQDTNNADAELTSASEIPEETPSNETVTQADVVNYEWKIIQRMPVEYPPRAIINNTEGWVDVEVTINPNGEVVSATVDKVSRTGRIFRKNAIESVEQWLFEPPSASGISSNLTRIYRIEFDL